MQSESGHSGEMSQNSERGPAHRSGVDADDRSTESAAQAGASAPAEPGAPRLQPAIDPAARSGKRLYNGLSASAAGLELGIAVAIGALFGRWLDGKLGTEPWMLMVFLLVGLVAGFRGLLRAVARADKAEEADRG
jgi:ATP synthase protein I